MQVVADRAAEPIAIQTDLRAIFVSLELSRSTWLITSLSPGGGEKMSKHSVQAGDIAGLLRRFAQLKEKARVRTGRDFPIIVIQEAGLDGFWIHRVLQSEGIESHVVDAASILTSRRRRRAKKTRSAEAPDRTASPRWGETTRWMAAPVPTRSSAGLAMILTSWIQRAMWWWRIRPTGQTSFNPPSHTRCLRMSRT